MAEARAPAVLDLSEKVALVTGASRGIGRAIAERFLCAGATVIATARSIEAADFSVPDRVTALAGSIDDPDHRKALAKAAFKSHRRLDILVNNAGIMRPGVFGMTAETDIDQVLAVNLASAIHLTQDVSRLMSRGGGSVINIASIIGERGQAGQIAYAASKAGIIGMTRALAKELGGKGIRVNAISPGYIETAMTETLGDDVRADTLARIPLGRTGQPGDVADAALYLASDLSAYVTGQVLGVDGGMVL